MFCTGFVPCKEGPSNILHHSEGRADWRELEFVGRSSGVDVRPRSSVDELKRACKRRGAGPYVTCKYVCLCLPLPLRVVDLGVCQFFSNSNGRPVAF